MKRKNQNDIIEFKKGDQIMKALIYIAKLLVAVAVGIGTGFLTGWLYEKFMNR